MTRRQLLRLLAAAPALAVTGCTAQSASSQQEKPLILRYAENQPEDYPTSKAAKAFAELVAQRTGGRVKVLVYSGAELGAEQSVIQQMQFGGVDFSRVSLSQLAEYEPELSVLQLPYLYSDAQQMWRVLDGDIGDEFLAMLDGMDLVGLSWFDAGVRSFYTREKVTGLDDLQGLTIRVQGQALTDVCRLMVKGISSFSLMAVPFFITMGVLMGSGGISEKLIALADACVGWMRGGMAMVNIVASYFFGGISGSASADTASIGSIMIPMMVDQGYGADFSTAVTITSSCEGLLVPPSHNMVIYATTAGGISVGSLFLAGYLPGALLAIVLMIGSYIISVKRNYPKGDPFSIKAFVKQLGTSIWALAAVIIVVFGVVGGVFTATESAAIAVIYSLLVSVFVYKGLDWKGVWHALDECVNTLSIVLILIATSAVFGNCLTMLHVPDLAATAITDLTDNPYIIALLIDLILLVLGMIMDMAPIILIATPILLPIATSIGIDPIQFGIIVVLNCGIGLLTPPVGSVLFIGSAVAKRPMEKVVKATLPFYLCMFIALLLLTYIPDISLAIPKLLGGYVSPIANPLGPVFIH